MARRGPHDLSTVRSLATISTEVSDSQILDVVTAAPLRPVKPAGRQRVATFGDLVATAFFAEGNRQEESGVYNETEHVPIHSLDRVPRRWGPALTAAFVVVVAAGACGWWLGSHAFVMLAI